MSMFNGNGQDNRSLPAGWGWSTLGKYRKIKRQSITPSRFPDQVFELYSIPAFVSGKPEIVLGKEVGSSKQMVSANEVLISKINPRINRSWVVRSYTEHPKIASTEWFIFDVNEQLSPGYLCYFMQMDSFRDHLAANVSGVGGSLMRARPSAFENYPFPVAPLHEQERIVSRIEELFSDLDAGVAALERVRAGLKRYKGSVLGAAVKGKLVEQDAQERSGEEFLRELGKTAISADGRADLPAGWCWTKVNDLFDVSYGLSESLSKTEPNDELDIPVVRIPNITEFGSLNVEHLKYFPLGEKQKRKLLLKKGDVLFNWRNAPKWVGRSAVFNLDGEYVNASFLLKLRPQGTGYSGFISMYMNFLRISGYFMSIVNNAVNQANFNATRTAEVEVPFPPPDEQQRIMAEVERRLSIAQTVEKTLNVGLSRAGRLRQSVLKSAFEGRLL
jgi:type I restriction enzyme, S subunit